MNTLKLTHYGTSHYYMHIIAIHGNMNYNNMLEFLHYRNAIHYPGGKDLFKLI